MPLILLFLLFWTCLFFMGVAINTPIDLFMLLISPRWLALIGISLLVAWFMGES
ncbi:MAG: hypothetical protein IGR76_16765 [Synechococcales cyanobacterium T60_A2020_003]|nr:hypothetical protein [Synechococcales cyanobacterium T60_A2020_003]